MYYLPVAFVTIFKSLTNLLIMTGEYLIYGEKPSSGVVASGFIIVLGAVLTGANDAIFNVVGYSWMAANCFATLGYVLYMRRLSRLKMSKHSMSVYNLALAVPTATLCATLFNEFPGFFTDHDWSSPAFLGAILFSGALGFVMTFVSFWCMAVTSATTYCMVGALNKIPLSILGVWLFAEPVTWQLALSIAVGLSGGVLFSVSQTMQKQNQKKTEPESSTTDGKLEGLEEGRADVNKG